MFLLPWACTWVLGLEVSCALSTTTNTARLLALAVLVSPRTSPLLKVTCQIGSWIVHQTTLYSLCWVFPMKEMMKSLHTAALLGSLWQTPGCYTGITDHTFKRTWAKFFFWDRWILDHTTSEEIDLTVETIFEDLRPREGNLRQLPGWVYLD
jgi:hypothetical protein